ncbi:hypothetical protein PORY_002531 [Pneumocystis oryctolagi]|uniref:Uncharacterized protein n=1 Tax=Pneumocystis oryctolagi TaxID=42067 RepID=A0ACB7CAR4_9ASCO|nr:hypothetical protein PORY_002531 [Pneumocystis oryctolagi]
MTDPKSLLEKADKKSAGHSGFFSFFSSNKYSEAAELYLAAANAFRLKKQGREAGEAFEKAASMQLKLDEKDEAANTLVEAYKAYRKTNPEDAARVIESAIQMFTYRGNFRRAASYKMDVAVLYETELMDLQKALESYDEAGEWYSSDQAEALANKAYLKVAEIAAVEEQYSLAIQKFEEVARKSINNNLTKWSVKDYFFKAGLCHLNSGDMVATRRALEHYIDLDLTFQSTREYKFLEVDILYAVESGNPDIFTEKVREYDQISKLDNFHFKANFSSLSLKKNEEDFGFQKHQTENYRFSTFEECHIRPSIIKALKLAFPYIHKPTAVQLKIFSALASKSSLLIRSWTGTGKSFALSLYALNCSRSISKEKSNTSTLTSVILVPSNDLAYQYKQWIESILKNYEKSVKHIEDIIQVLTRNNFDENIQIERLKQFPNPHILVSTPNRLLDILSDLGESYKDYIDFKNLQSIIVDEADYVLNISKYYSIKNVIQNRYHPSPGQILLQYIITSRNKMSKTKAEFLADNYQLICSSATLDKRLKQLIYSKNWNRYQIIPLIDMTDNNIRSSFRIPFKITHHILKISLKENDKIYIMDAILPELEKNKMLCAKKRIGKKNKEKIEQSKDIFMINNPKNIPINLEDIIISALDYLIKSDNVKNAIIFISHTLSRKKFVEKCQFYGLSSVVELRESMLQSKTNQDRIYVMNYLSARGIDLPELTHVYMIGRINDDINYIHMAGRIGRMGNSGKIISIIPSSSTKLEDDYFSKEAAAICCKIGIKIDPYFTKTYGHDIPIIKTF